MKQYPKTKLLVLNKIFYISILLLFFSNNISSQVSVDSLQLLIENNAKVPKTEFERKTFQMPQGEYQEVMVKTEDDFYGADFSKHIIFNIKRDIALTKTLVLNSKKGIVIQGNGHRLYQKGECYSKKGKEGKWRYAQLNKPLKGDELFVDQKGHILRWSESDVYQAESWTYNDSTKMVEILLPSTLYNLTINRKDNVYINYSMWFVRQKNIISEAKDGKLYFKNEHGYKPNEMFRSWTKSPYFYLENYSKQYNHLFLKDDKIYWPINKKEIFRCDVLTGIIISHTSYVDCYDVEFGPSVEHMVVNYGKSRFTNCRFGDTESIGILSKGDLYVINCTFENITKNCITSSSQSYTEVLSSHFNNIGKRGSNKACIFSSGNCYIAHNTFADFNYSALILGNISTKNKNELPSYIVEYNSFLWSKEWSEQMTLYGLNDSGAIYIGTNNKQGIVRYNIICNFGGLGNNRGIFCDDGAYNLAIYGNIISDIQNSYDIDSRNCSGPSNTRLTPKGNLYNTNNYIGYNICSGSVKMEGNSRINENGCVFVGNIILGNLKSKKNKISNYSNKSESEAIINDKGGVIEQCGFYVPTLDLNDFFRNND